MIDYISSQAAAKAFVDYLVKHDNITEGEADSIVTDLLKHITNKVTSCKKCGYKDVCDQCINVKYNCYHIDFCSLGDFNGVRDNHVNNKHEEEQ